ncbi:MAG: hypothetical protein M3203_08575, partial [Actinomycetota bacterium]|nr:hypothetical protein [Actinomycetota bacterium]
MQHRDRLGHFWLPDDPADVVPGLLSFNERGVTLQLLGLFKADHRDSGEPGDIHHPVVLGDLENYRESAAVLGCESVFTGRSGWSMYSANAALVGAATDAMGYLDVRSVAFELTGLGLLLPWADHEGRREDQSLTERAPGTGRQSKAAPSRSSAILGDAYR